MQVTTLSLFRFGPLSAKGWAFMQMGLAPARLRQVPGLGFFKMLGTGRGDGFNPAPDFSVYAILATWPSLERARAALRTESVFCAYRDHAREMLSVFLSANKGHGTWDGVAPFDYERVDGPLAPVGVLTRATIKREFYLPFWRSVPNVSAMTADRSPLRFCVGLGERPIKQLMTFSIWDDVDAVKAFAYHDGHHRRSLRRAREGQWFTEELFVRFRVLGTEGTWEGADPLGNLATERPLAAQ